MALPRNFPISHAVSGTAIRTLQALQFKRERRIWEIVLTLKNAVFEAALIHARIIRQFVNRSTL